jgi:hypothetical protein
VENLKKHHLVDVPAKIHTRYFPNTSQKHYHLRKHPSGHSRENSDNPVHGQRCKCEYEIQLTEIYFKDSYGLNWFRRAPRSGIFPEQTNNTYLAGSFHCFAEGPR